MQLRFLHVSGPSATPANVDFVPGLNVISGPSNTGKSHILRLIDYVLGAQNPPEPIAEQALYDLAHLGVAMDDGSEKTLVRALQGGGDTRVIDGLVKTRPGPKEGVSLSANHRAKASLSKMLLETLGAGRARVRTAASGTTRDLSYRDLDRYALITETKIQAPTSPVLTGQYISKTAETSIFKYVLTGVDDSALDMAKPETTEPIRQAMQLELLDHQIRELEQEITQADHDQEELEKLDLSLDAELAQSFQVQEEAESDYRQLTGQRRRPRNEYENTQDRIAEIDTLLARFSLLEQPYGSDQDRLAAVIEAGTLFALEDGEVCPICGAEPGSIALRMPAMAMSMRSSRPPSRKLQMLIVGRPNSR
jgi:AAA domain